MFFFFQAEDGIRDLVRSRGLGDVYKRQPLLGPQLMQAVKDYKAGKTIPKRIVTNETIFPAEAVSYTHLTLPTIYSV